MDIRGGIQSQHLSALTMLKRAIVKCPQAVWNEPKDSDGVWFKSYHALCYAHLCLQPARGDHIHWRGHAKPVSSPPLAKGEVLPYLAFVEQEVLRRVPSSTSRQARASARFVPYKLELQFVNIRHIQHHAGELYKRLGSRRSIKLDWAERRRRTRRTTTRDT
jgi:hypothetical protein